MAHTQLTREIRKFLYEHGPATIAQAVGAVGKYITAAQAIRAWDRISAYGKRSRGPNKPPQCGGTRPQKVKTGTRIRLRETLFRMTYGGLLVYNYDNGLFDLPKKMRKEMDADAIPTTLRRKVLQFVKAKGQCTISEVVGGVSRHITAAQAVRAYYRVSRAVDKIKKPKKKRWGKPQTVGKRIVISNELSRLARKGILMHAGKGTYRYADNSTSFKENQNENHQARLRAD